MGKNGYTQRLYQFVNRKGFVRCFYGTCPQCGKHIFSVGDDVVDNNKIRAKFVCECGKKYKETVYSAEMKRYKYPQALVYPYKDKKRGNVNTLKLYNRIYLITPTKIMSKEVKS